MTDDSVSFDDADTDQSGSLSEEELNQLTMAQIRAIAAEKGYQVSGSTKAALIAAFLEAQG